MQGSELDFPVILGRRVKAMRQQAGMTQDMLANRCGIFKTYLARIEAGKANPTILVIAALAESLDVAPYSLFIEPEDLAPGSAPRPR